jgi:hypothetical protein
MLLGIFTSTGWTADLELRVMERGPSFTPPDAYSYRNAAATSMNHTDPLPPVSAGEDRAACDDCYVARHPDVEVINGSGRNDVFHPDVSAV